MNKLEALYDVTKQLSKNLNRVDEPGIDRDMLIDQVNELIEKRSIIIQDIDQPHTAEEISIAKEMVHLNKHINRQMNRLNERIKDDLKQIKKKKAQNYSYLKPYGDLKISDGMYMDNKL